MAHLLSFAIADPTARRDVVGNGRLENDCAVEGACANANHACSHTISFTEGAVREERDAGHSEEGLFL